MTCFSLTLVDKNYALRPCFFLPWLSLLLQGKVLSGIVCLVLQLTLIGWIPACIWAFTALNRMYADRRANQVIRELKRQR